MIVQNIQLLILFWPHHKPNIIKVQNIKERQSKIGLLNTNKGMIFAVSFGTKNFVNEWIIPARPPRVV